MKVQNNGRFHIPASADTPNSISPKCPKKIASVIFMSCPIRMLIMTGKLMSQMFLYVVQQ